MKNKKRRNPFLRIFIFVSVLLLIAVMALAVLTGFLNPAGDGAFTYLYKTMQGNTTQSINEHLPLTLIENTEFATTLVIFLLVLIFTDTKIRLADLFMFAGITYLSFKSRSCAVHSPAFFVSWYSHSSTYSEGIVRPNRSAH